VPRLFRIGIAWQGNPTFPNDRERSVPLLHFAPLAAVPGVRLYALQGPHRGPFVPARAKRSAMRTLRGPFLPFLRRPDRASRPAAQSVIVSPAGASRGGSGGMVAEAKSGSRVFLLSSLALGVLAMVAAFVFLQNTAGKETGPSTKVLVARRDLRENTVLDPDKDLRVVEVPNRMTDLLGLAVNPDMETAYKGQRVNRPILAGQLLLKADMAAEGVLELHGDKFAMPVPVKSSNGFGLLLVPGDYVRLMVTHPLPPKRIVASSQPTETADPSNNQEFVTVEIPTSFKVLAVNNRLSKTRLQVTASEAYQSASENIANPTILLEVTDAEAKMILEQTGAGKYPVTLLMCPAPAGSTGSTAGSGGGAR
jgi:Flp pilus assembly protein CpaB